jgi:hypothetical protein
VSFEEMDAASARLQEMEERLAGLPEGLLDELELRRAGGARPEPPAGRMSESPVGRMSESPVRQPTQASESC